MSEMSSSEQRLAGAEFVHYAVIDADGLLIPADDMKDAKQCAAHWNKQYAASGPHRAVEVYVREIK